LDKYRFEVSKEEISLFEANHCVAGVDANRHIAVRVILEYTANVS
jgi:hypothetical protein